MNKKTFLLIIVLIIISLTINTKISNAACACGSHTETEKTCVRRVIICLEWETKTKTVCDPCPPPGSASAQTETSTSAATNGGCILGAKPCTTYRCVGTRCDKFTSCQLSCNVGSCPNNCGATEPPPVPETNTTTPAANNGSCAPGCAPCTTYRCLNGKCDANRRCTVGGKCEVGSCDNCSGESSGENTCGPIQECKAPNSYKYCKLCNADYKCVSEKICVKQCPQPCEGDDFCKSIAHEVIYNKCINGRCTSVKEPYGIAELTDECSPVGSSCSPGCQYSECEVSRVETFRLPNGDMAKTPFIGYSYSCRPSPYATSNECTTSNDCVQKYGGESSSPIVSEKFCDVQAYAGTDPSKKNVIIITATNLKGTTLSKCNLVQIGNEFLQKPASLPYTYEFLENIISQSFTIQCEGNKGFKNCNSKIITSVDLEPFVPPPEDDIPVPVIPQPKNCEIIDFQVPHQHWIGYKSKAEWNTSIDCTWAEITCELENGESCGGPEIETLSEDNIKTGERASKDFYIKKPGIYQYTLKACVDKNNENTCKIWKDSTSGLEYIEVQALELPDWQEIIPVLPNDVQGFLKKTFSYLGDIIS